MGLQRRMGILSQWWVRTSTLSSRNPTVNGSNLTSKYRGRARGFPGTAPGRYPAPHSRRCACIHPTHCEIISPVVIRTPELNLAAVASRSSLVGALLRNAVPSHRQSVLDFLRGLSRDELECLAEFHGAWILESLNSCCSPYSLLTRFFDSDSERWHSSCDKSHKSFVVLSYLDHLTHAVSIRIQPPSFTTVADLHT